MTAGRQTETATPAVVLRSTAVGEADLMLSMLTPLRGRLELRAAAARKSKRRFPGGLPVGARGQATVAGKSSRAPGQVGRLLSFEPRADNSAIGRSLEGFAYTAYICEVADQLVSGSQADPRTFAVLVQALEAALDRARPVVLRAYELRLLEALGHLPALDACCVCGTRTLDAPGAQVAFELRRGGVLCSEHAAVVGARISADVVRVAHALVDDADLERADTRLESLTPTERRALRDLVLEIVRGHLRRPLRSRALFAQLLPQRVGRGGTSK